MILNKVKAKFRSIVKNAIGWKTKRKIVVFSVDDYGNVRLDSKLARQNMDKAGMKIFSRFDMYDTLETKQDLEQLFEVLKSVKDKNGNHAIFTAFSTTCNIDFERMADENYLQYHYETLPETYKKLAQLNPVSYQGAWELWLQGIKQNLIKPQFHGREHLNLNIFNEKLKNKDKFLLTALENRSYTSISDEEYPTMSYTAAFDFWEEKDQINFNEIIKEGLNKFEQVFGFKSNYFTPPVYNIQNKYFKELKNNGIKYIDLGLVRNEHLGYGKYKKSFNYIGKKTDAGLRIIVRNVVFEPTEDRGIDWVSHTINQIEDAFRWNKPAIISSHRVNFCGHIDSKNRDKGLSDLKNLLQTIIKKWPDVEFMSADELGDIISK